MAALIREQDLVIDFTKKDVIVEHKKVTREDKKITGEKINLNMIYS